MTPRDEARIFLRHLYDAYRTARMNRLYYGWRLTALKRWNLGFEISIALASSAVVAAWGIWRVGAGQLAWNAVAGIGALLALVKPFLQLAERIERYGRLYAGHGDVCFDLERVVERVAETHLVVPEHRAAYDACGERTRKLAPEDEPNPRPRVLRRAYEQVKREIPAAGLWMP